MKKLLVFTSTFPRWKNDNLPPFVYELSKRLTNDFDITVLTPHYPGAKTEETMGKLKVCRFRYFFEKYEKLAAGNGMLPTLKKNKLYYLEVPLFLIAEFLALRREIKRNRPDIVHAHWIIPQGFIAALIKKLYDIPYVVTSHGSDILGIKGFKFIKRFILRNANRITVVSNTIKNEILKNIDFKLKNKLEVIPMGIDSKLFSPNKRDLSIRRRYEIKGPFLLFVGRLAPEKGVGYLIDAMPKILEKFQKAKLMIIGYGVLKEELENLTNRLNLKESVIFTGKIRNDLLPSYYATSDVFISPSLREGSPVSYIEALACGTPIIVGDMPVSREIVKKFGGFIVKQNKKDISRVIIKFLRKSHFKKKNTCFKKNYDLDSIANKFRGMLV